MSRTPRSLTRLRLYLLLALGCGPAAPAAAPAPPTSVAPSAHTAGGDGAADLLPPDARYVDLVRAAIELDAPTRAPGSCLLAASARGYALRGALAAAVRPLPLPSEDLDAALKSAPQLEILSALGRYGDGSGKLAIAGYTTPAARREALALLFTDLGVHVRPPSGSARAPAEAPDAARAIAQLGSTEGLVVFIAAEAGVRLATIVQAIELLSARGVPVVLAVNLAPNTQLPQPTGGTRQVARCPEGLPATAEPEGSLPVAALAAGVAPLKEQASDCLEQGDARGAAGGRVELALRVGASGRVQEVCVTREAVGDPGVLACVLARAQRLSFASPAPGGVVDIGLPLALVPGPSAAAHEIERPLCPP